MSSEPRKEKQPFNWGSTYADIVRSRERAKERKRADAERTQDHDSNGDTQSAGEPERKDTLPG